MSKKKIYCKDCEYRVGHESAMPLALIQCYVPIDSWFSRKSPWQGRCRDRNAKNDCKDFVKKKPKRKKKAKAWVMDLSQ